jgi:hypothetical protein
MDGITTSKSSFVVTDIIKFIAAIDAGKVSLSIEVHKTRSSREIYYLHAHIEGKSNKLYFSLPTGQHIEKLEDEVPKLILKIAVDKDGVPVSPEMAKFESEYRTLMKEKVEPLLIEAAKIDSKKSMVLANFGKSESSTMKFVLCQLPRTIKTDQITRLIEAKGSHVLLSVAYMYTLDDSEKGRLVYGSIFETGRFPFTEKTESVVSNRKRKSEDELGSEAKKEREAEIAAPELKTEAP